MRTRTDIRPLIVKGTIDWFNKKGPRFTLDEMVSSIHISKKSIYKFFRTKSDIYTYILQEINRQCQVDQKSIYEDQEMDVKDKLHDLLTFKSNLIDMVDCSKLYLLEEAEPEFFNALLESFDKNWHYGFLLLEDAKKKGIIASNFNSDLFICIISSTLKGLASTDILAKTGMSFRAAMNNLVDALLNGAILDNSSLEDSKSKDSYLLS